MKALSATSSRHRAYLLILQGSLQDLRGCIFLFDIQVSNFAHATCERSDPLTLASAKKAPEGISVLPRNRKMNAVTEEMDNATARSVDSSAIEETSSMLLERRATMVGMKVRIEAPEDHRAGKSLGTLSMMQRSIV